MQSLTKQSRLTLLREEHLLTVAELARRVGVARELVSQIEHGARRPWPKIRVALARELGVDEASLFPESER